MTATKQTDWKHNLSYDTYFTMCMLRLESGGCVMCVSVFVAYYRLTNSLVEEGEVLHWGKRGRTGGKSVSDV